MSELNIPKPTHKAFNYIRGVNLSTARRIVRYEFQDFLIRVEQNNRDHTYDIYLKPGVDQENIEFFQAYWGKNYRIFNVTETEMERQRLARERQDFNDDGN